MAAVIDSALPSAITDDFDVGQTLGTGHFSKVKLGTNKKTGEKVAIKIINKPTGSKIAMLKAEVDILMKCDHPNIVKMYKCYETDKIHYLVLELLTGGELFDTIIAKGHYSEADARQVTITLLDGIRYLHTQNVAHRDLKPENILLKDKTNAAAIKITDFGLSKIFADDAAGEVIMKTACGTPGYVAPEVLGHDAYSSQVDLWSIGVIVYILLCGFPPFYGDNDAQMFKRIKAGQYKFLAPYWDPISADAKDFVRNLLVVDPKKRMTAAEALNHKWLGRTAAVSTKNLFASLTPPAAPDGTKKGSSASSAKKSSAGGAGDLPDVSEQSSATPEPEGMKAQMMQYNVERKVALPENLKRAFELPEGETRVAKFTCSLGNTFGQMHVTSSHICFLGAFNKKLKVPLKDVKTLAKRKRFFLSPGNGHSLHVSDAKERYEFHALNERDITLKTILGQCAALSLRPTVLEIGQ